MPIHPVLVLTGAAMAWQHAMALEGGAAVEQAYRLDYPCAGIPAFPRRESAISYTTSQAIAADPRQRTVHCAQNPFATRMESAQPA